MYNFKVIDRKWQKIWEVTNAFKTTDQSAKKYYALDMFPYPSGSGLHVGHPEGYLATDIVARMKRLQGYDVLHPIGWDAFGLPAEQYAIKTGQHPGRFTLQNIANFRKQLKALGFSYDYQKEVNTTDPQYYKWTQWIFAQMYQHNLAEIRATEVNWCAELGTVLANEEVVEDATGQPVSERGGFAVTKRQMRQWVLKITDYAEQLLAGLETLDWPHSLVALQKNWIGKQVKNGKTTYHLRDWIFARQRYWGEPFPIYFDAQNNIYLIEDLPVLLPHVEAIKPAGDGSSPLANESAWVNFEVEGKRYRRETNTMPQWAGSSWYYLAYILKNEDGSYLALNSPEAYKRFQKWMPVDLYIGGQEHAVLHLLYARFWHKVLYDLKIVPHPEPFAKVINQGMILGSDGQKMSKSKGNVIDPEVIIAQYGADTLRVYEMFMGPLTETKPWSHASIDGIYKWLSRVVRIFTTLFSANCSIQLVTTDNEMTTHTHRLIKEVEIYITQLKFNLAISKLMVYINHLYKAKTVQKTELIAFLILLAPFAPHLAEELLELSQTKQIKLQTWPRYDQTKIAIEETTIMIQVAGKVRAKITTRQTLSKAEAVAIAQKKPHVQKYLAHKKILKVIYVANKILNFVTN